MVVIIAYQNNRIGPTIYRQPVHAFTYQKMGGQIIVGAGCP